MAEIWSTLVGAGAVVVGAGLTGGFTLLKGRQERTDKERDRLEQRITRHREIRREAYLQLLDCAQKLSLCQGRFVGVDGLPDDLQAELGSAMRDLSRSLLVVRMEGPVEVAAAARDLVGHYDQLNGHILTSGGVSHRLLLEAHTATLGAREEFLRVTAKALDSAG
ncbi:hypothetical protein [Streptomyces sp. NPDC006855]|uniref:hypothetical protein n=1 Tax=Streptomyces sp. NPDC006855 TaxID=3364765 RepID=UPI0036CB31A7